MYNSVGKYANNEQYVYFSIKPVHGPSEMGVKFEFLISS